MRCLSRSSDCVRTQVSLAMAGLSSRLARSATCVCLARERRVLLVMKQVPMALLDNPCDGCIRSQVRLVLATIAPAAEGRSWNGFCICSDSLELSYLGLSTPIASVIVGSQAWHFRIVVAVPGMHVLFLDRHFLDAGLS